jgi:hypothetical protein
MLKGSAAKPIMPATAAAAAAASIRPSVSSTAMIPDYTRRNVKGTAYLTPCDEYSPEGTCIGVGTRERLTYAMACGVAYASPVEFQSPEYKEDIFSIFYS